MNNASKFVLTSNPPRDEAMDLHNNAIGYDHKYRSFRGRWIRDRYNWKLWSRNVHAYVKAMDGSMAKNGKLMETWLQTSPPTSLTIARQQMTIEGVKNSTFIFYR